MSEMKKTTSSVDVEGEGNEASSQTINSIDCERKIIMAVDLYVYSLQHPLIITFSSRTTYSGLAWAQSRKV